MYPPPFRYHRASSLHEAVSLLSELRDPKILAGGQSLIPLMKLRLSAPQNLVDLNFIPGLSYVQSQSAGLRIGAMTRHAEIEASPELRRIPILYDCASGIADVQVRNRGTIGGSLAEADPSGDWAPVLLTLQSEVICVGPGGERAVPVGQFITDAYTTALQPGEIVREVRIERPPKSSAGAYLAFKRCAPVYATASVAVQLTLEDGNICSRAAIALGCVGLTAIKAEAAEAALRGKRISAKSVAEACEAARSAADPQPDMRGSVAYKRNLVGALLKKALNAAVRRCRGEQVELSHEYA